MLSLCEKCEPKKLPALDNNPNETNHYYQWVRNEEDRVNKFGKKYTLKAMTKKKISSTNGKILAETNKSIPKYLEHLHNTHNQYQVSQELHKALDGATAIQKSDFSEGWATKYNTEIQSMHFGGARVILTLHTNVYYIFNPISRKIESIKVCSVLEDPRHTAAAVYAHLRPLFEKFSEARIKNLHVFTDGPTGQYRNKTAFFLMRHFAELYQFDYLIWHYWESGHGKGPQDGVGAVVKFRGDM